MCPKLYGLQALYAFLSSMPHCLPFNIESKDKKDVIHSPRLVYLHGRGRVGAQNTYIPRVPQCLFPRPNWDPPSALLQASISPSEQKGGHTRLLIRRWAVPIRTTGEKALHSVYSVGRRIQHRVDIHVQASLDHFLV
jgi:hypothetical protein